ncbi:MAG: alpha/beta hydrolase [Bacteroidales bacterium]|nr:alpha/beta hydrolase [Bacteroidales bacterium]
MKFYEFGTKNERTLMLLHGNASTWEMSFGESIPLLSERYHVIAVGMDGFDPSDDTEYISGEEEAAKIEEYIISHLGGEVFSIYTASLGGVPAMLMCFNDKVKIKNLILDGAEKLSFGILNRPFAKFAANIGYKLAQGKSRLLIRMILGVPPDMLDELMFTGASKKTLLNACYASTRIYPNVPKGQPRTDIRVAFWYGSKEKGLCKKGAKALRKYFPELEEREYKDYSHGSILQHPEQLCNEIDSFLNS